MYSSPVAAEKHAVMREVGRLVALLHDGGMVHGDLTTSNMMLRESDGLLVRLRAATSTTISRLTWHPKTCKRVPTSR